MAKVKSWLRYQQDVADYLASLGFETKVNETIEGIRGRHAIDVTARYTKAGFELLWIVECKLWNRPVEKEKVLAFLRIVEQVGADRGLFVAESGFQAGVIPLVQATNVTLTTLADIRSMSAGELTGLRYRAASEMVSDLSHRLNGLQQVEELPNVGHAIQRISYPPGVDVNLVILLLGWLSYAQSLLDRARRGQYPLAYQDLTRALTSPNSAGLEILMTSMDRLLDRLDISLNIANELITAMESSAEPN